MKRTVRAVACLVCIFTGHAIGATTSTFDSTLGGWTSNTPAEISWAGSGGTPGGYARFDDVTSNHTFLFAPPSYLGDWSGLDGTGSISYDHNMIWLTPSGFAATPYTVKISGPGGEATWTGSIATRLPGWDTKTALISESEWNIDSGTWDAILANVTELSIRIEQFSNMDICGLDNITLAIAEPGDDLLVADANEPNAAIPEPMTMLAVGLSVTGLGGYVRRRRRC